MAEKPNTLSKQSLSQSCNGYDWQPYAPDKFEESNELSQPKLYDVDHEELNDPKQAFYPTFNALLQLNAQLKFYN